MLSVILFNQVLNLDRKRNTNALEFTFKKLKLIYLFYLILLNYWFVTITNLYNLLLYILSWRIIHSYWGFVNYKHTSLYHCFLERLDMYRTPFHNNYHGKRNKWICRNELFNGTQKGLRLTWMFQCIARRSHDSIKCHCRGDKVEGIEALPDVVYLG